MIRFGLSLSGCTTLQSYKQETGMVAGRVVNIPLPITNENA